MKQKYLALCFLLFSFKQLSAQQYGLFNTKTLFDGFENPAQKTFVLDSSRKFASNFFLPSLGINAANQGNNDIIRKILNEGVYTAKGIPIGTNQINTIHENSNIYMFNFKIFKSYKYHKEIGLSWQIRTDAHVNYTNETLAIFDNYQRFLPSDPDKIANYKDAFNNNGYAQTYHQFSVSYRENYNKRLAFGLKLSLLSGITYNNLRIKDSNFYLGSEDGPLMISLNGTYKASFLETNELSKKSFLPLFKNPGVAASFGTTYESKSGVFLMANIKDLGVIRWGKSSYSNHVASSLTIEDPQNNSSATIEKEVKDLVLKNAKHSSFYSLTNAKADVMISKTFDFYTPAIILSKNLFYTGGDAAWVSKFSYKDFSISAIPSYNFNKLFLFGMQGMYRTPNFELFLGSDNLFKTMSQINGAIQQDVTVGSGYNGASVYFGIGIKFGSPVEHPQNSSTMPGINDQEGSFFKKIFSVFSKKRK